MCLSIKMLRLLINNLILVRDTNQLDFQYWYCNFWKTNIDIDIGKFSNILICIPDISVNSFYRKSLIQSIKKILNFIIFVVFPVFIDFMIWTFVIRCSVPNNTSSPRFKTLLFSIERYRIQQSDELLNNVLWIQLFCPLYKSPTFIRIYGLLTQG